MKKSILAYLLLITVVSVGCSGKFWGGAAGGAVGAGAGYEIYAEREMDRIEDARKAGTMDQEEFEIRKDQIERMSLFQRSGE